MDVKYDRKASNATEYNPTPISVDIEQNGDIEMEERGRTMSQLQAAEAVKQTTAALESIFGADHVVLMESYTHSARYQVGTDELSIADVFEHMESIKERCTILNYAVSQISLEQIFLGFAKEQREENDDKIEDNRTKCQICTAGCFGCMVIG